MAMQFLAGAPIILVMTMSVVDAPVQRAEPPISGQQMDIVARRLVLDLHTPKPTVFWADLAGSVSVGWLAFALSVASRPWSVEMATALAVSGFALYRALCFTHELTHLRRGALPGFETGWNLLVGVPLLLPSFTYVGVHQSHHSLATYGTQDDPEYLPFAHSRLLILLFALQASLLFPPVMLLRFLVLAPLGLIWPRLHRWLEQHASSFSMNPSYRRSVSPAVASKIRRWELITIVFWGSVLGLLLSDLLPWRTIWVWLALMTFVSFFNALRVLGAHEYETDGSPRDRHGQLRDSIDTPGGVWTELWAPVGLRYHALHHYFPGIPYHNLGVAYRRLAAAFPPGSQYQESTSPGLHQSLTRLWQRARRRSRKLIDWVGGPAV
jgi:fatty acid desaturase